MLALSSSSTGRNDGAGKDAGSHDGADEVSPNVDAPDSDEFPMEINNQ